MLGNGDDLLKAVVEKLKRSHSSNFGTFSTIGMNGNLFGCGGMVGSVHGGMVGVVDSEICCTVDFFAVVMEYGNHAGNMLRLTQPVLLNYMQELYGCIVVQLLLVKCIGNHLLHKRLEPPMAVSFF